MKLFFIFVGFFFLGVLVQFVHSIPPSFDVTSIGKETFNSSGVFGLWNVKKDHLYADRSRNCQFWNQSDGEFFTATLTPTQRVNKAWVEIVADLSGINGLGPTAGYNYGINLLGFKRSAYVAALIVMHSATSPSGMQAQIFSNHSFRKESAFDIPYSPGFHTYTLSYDYETNNITVYVDDVYVTSAECELPKYDMSLIYECGYGIGNNVKSNGTGKLYVKECNSFIPAIKSLYVNGVKGKDTNDGLTESTPLKTVQAAAYRAGSGTTVYISDGIYRESVTAPSGTDEGLVTFVGTGNDVIISGAVSASDFKWTRGSDNIWVADVSSELFKAPLIVTYKNKDGEYVRCHQARTPNFRVETPWNWMEFWGTAMGGKEIMDCFEQPGCDDSDNADSRMLSDEAFKTMDDLVGAQIIVTDRTQDYFVYNNTIVKHDKKKGTITIDKEQLDDGKPALGMYSTYYVYGKRSMIDAEGEYAFENGKLYIKWSHDSLPDSLEFSNREIGLSLAGQNYLKFDNIHFMHYEKYAVYEIGGWSSRDFDSCGYIYFDNCILDYNTMGIYIDHGASNSKSSVHDWHVNNCSVTHCDSYALYISTDSYSHFPNVAVYNFWMTNNYFYHLGFLSRFSDGLRADCVRDFYFVNNTVKYVRRHGFCMNYVSEKDGEISTGSILFRGNLFDQNCMGTADCGCLRFFNNYGKSGQVWKNALVTENVMQNSFGWSKACYYRNIYRGFGGMGVYNDYASNLVFYRNIVYNCPVGITFYKGWETGPQSSGINNLIVGEKSL